MKFSRFWLWFQFWVDYFLMLPTYFLVLAIGKIYLCLRLEDRNAVRLEFKRILKQHSGPLIICPNHLTYVDSPIVQVALASPWTYFWRPHAWAWNFPKISNVKGNFFFAVMCFLGKCILLPAQENALARKITLDKIEYLLKKGQYAMIFPEGTRSKSGLVNDQDFGYGVGDLLQRVPSARILCVYSRGDRQIKKGLFPNKKQTIYIKMKCIKPKTTQTGLRGTRDLSRQIINTLVDMEQEFLSSRGLDWNLQK